MGATRRSCGTLSILVRLAGPRTAAIAISRTPSGGSAGTLKSSMTFDAASWHDYFLMVGGGAAALTGLVFVAMSLHLEQSAQAVALELILVLVGVEIILYLSIRQAMRASETADPALLWRTIGSFACLITEQVGAIVLYTGDARGLYAVGVGMMASFVFMVSGAWLLIVGVRREEAAEATA